VKRQAFVFSIIAVLGCSIVAFAITNGAIDTVHSYVGAVIAPNIYGFTGFTGGNGFVSCSGTLVSPRVFLTAGHCIALQIAFGVTPDKAHVAFDATNVYQPSNSWHDVSSWVIMPGFKARPGEFPDTNDVAVAILAEPIYGITPARLAPVGLLDTFPGLSKTTVSVLGYGLNEQSVFTGNRLIAASGVIDLTDSFLKTSHLPGGQCWFDSGGPALLVDQGIEYQVGILAAVEGTGSSTSVNSGCSNAYQTRVDTPAVQDFIQAQIAANP